ncbi:unnamed protein product [Linum trigynum]|uniref:Uncharacterized protein n=1 Tax=Linum trigynum TaxID=586398 RepID=A0AAV2DJ16_9ROSI
MSTSKAFTLKSDQIFITPCGGSSLHVCWYNGDLNDFQFQGGKPAGRRRLDEHWGNNNRVRVGPTEEQHEARLRDTS